MSRDRSPAPAAADDAPAGDTLLPERFLLQVEGVGTFLVLRSPLVRIGPVSGASPADIGLIADAATPDATIRRTDDDYFLTSDRPVSINDRSATQTLLADGDRLALSRHCRLRFRMPHPASTTAVLDVTAGRLPRVDIRHCLLAHRQIVIGPAPAAHIPVGDLAEPIVLQIDGDRLLAPRAGGVGASPLPLHQPLTLGPLHVRLERP